MDLRSRCRQDSCALSAGTVTSAMDLDTRDIVLTRVRSLDNIEQNVVENGTINDNHFGDRY